MAYSEGGQEKGIEIEIINEFVGWMRLKKKPNLSVKYVPHTDFEEFYKAVKKGPKNNIGLGSVTISADKAKEVEFSVPYLKDVAFCITNGNSPDVKTKTPDNIVRALGSMSALTIEKTSLDKYLHELKKQYLPDLRILNEISEEKILNEISKNVLYFAYVDAITFWYYLKTNPGKFIKMQRSLNQSKEQLGFIFPKGGKNKALFDEFFGGPTGFKSSTKYRAILEKNLGSYMTQNVSIQ